MYQVDELPGQIHVTYEHKRLQELQLIPEEKREALRSEAKYSLAP
jgi:hypothetical protein